MARTVALSSLRTQIRQRADLENSEFVTDAELTTWINASATELYDLLVAAYGQDYYLTSDSISVVSGTATYALPADFYQMTGLDIPYNGQVLTVRPFRWHERNRRSDLDGDLFNLRYQIQGGNLKFIPTPAATVTATLWYIPAFTSLAADDDTLDGINGWEEFVVIDCAIKARIKEEAGTTELERAKAYVLKRIEDMKGNRDSAEPMRVQDITSTDDSTWYPQGP